MMIAASQSATVRTLADVTQLAKQRPVTVGTAGTGSIGHLSTELFAQIAGIELSHVPYRGGNPAITDAIGGQIDLVFDTAAALLPFVNSGKLRAIAVGGAQAYAPLPTIPTLKSTLGADYESYSWFGLVAPKDTSNNVLDRLRSTMVKVSQSAENRRQLSEQGVEAGVANAAAFGKVIDIDSAKWSRIIKQASVTTE